MEMEDSRDKVRNTLTKGFSQEAGPQGSRREVKVRDTQAHREACGQAEARWETH